MNPEQAQRARMIGQRLRRIRLARGKGLVVVAGLAAMSKSKLDMLERGESALDKLSDIVALANALDVAPGDLVRLPLPAPANGNTDSTIEAVGRALDAVEDEDPDGLVLPVAVLREQVHRNQTRLRAGQFTELAAELPGLIRALHTTLNTGTDHAELLDLAVYLYVHVTRLWLFHTGAHTQLLRRVAFLTQRLARERDEVITLAMAGWGVAFVLLHGGEAQHGLAKLSSITLPPISAETAGLACLVTASHSIAAVLERRPGDAAAPMQATAELAERFGSTGQADSRGFLYGPVQAGIDRMWLALEADEPDEAVRVAQGLDLSRTIAMNRAMVWVLSGRALAQLPGRSEDAVRALRTAERIQSTVVLRNQPVRETLGELLTRGLVRGAMGVELRGMAYRAGVLTEQSTT